MKKVKKITKALRSIVITKKQIEILNHAVDTFECELQELEDQAWVVKKLKDLEQVKKLLYEALELED